MNTLMDALSWMSAPWLLMVLKIGLNDLGPVFLHPRPVELFLSFKISLIHLKTRMSKSSIKYAYNILVTIWYLLNVWILMNFWKKDFQTWTEHNKSRNICLRTVLHCSHCFSAACVDILQPPLSQPAWVLMALEPQLCITQQIFKHTCFQMGKWFLQPHATIHSRRSG